MFGSDGSNPARSVAGGLQDADRSVRFRTGAQSVRAGPDRLPATPPERALRDARGSSWHDILKRLDAAFWLPVQLPSARRRPIRLPHLGYAPKRCPPQTLKLPAGPPTLSLESVRGIYNGQRAMPSSRDCCARGLRQFAAFRCRRADRNKFASVQRLLVIQAPCPKDGPNQCVGVGSEPNRRLRVEITDSQRLATLG